MILHDLVGCSYCTRVTKMAACWSLMPKNIRKVLAFIGFCFFSSLSMTLWESSLRHHSIQSQENLEKQQNSKSLEFSPTMKYNINTIKIRDSRESAQLFMRPQGRTFLNGSPASSYPGLTVGPELSYCWGNHLASPTTPCTNEKNNQSFLSFTVGSGSTRF